MNKNILNISPRKRPKIKIFLSSSTKIKKNFFQLKVLEPYAVKSEV